MSTKLETLVAKGALTAGLVGAAELVRSIEPSLTFTDQIAADILLISGVAGAAYYGKEVAEAVGENHMISGAAHYIDDKILRMGAAITGRPMTQRGMWTARLSTAALAGALLLSSAIPQIFDYSSKNAPAPKPTQPAIQTVQIPTPTQAFPTSTPIPTSTPRPLPTATITPTPKPYIFKISQEEVNFLERVVYGEVAVYDINRRAEGFSVEQYDAAIKEQAPNIVQVIGNRRVHPKWIVDSNDKNFFYPTLESGGFSTVLAEGMERFFFRQNAPGTSELFRLGARQSTIERDGKVLYKTLNQRISDYHQLAGYTNTTKLTDAELKEMSASNKSFLNMKRKLELVKAAVSDYLTGSIPPADLWFSNVVFYQNEEITNDTWNKACMWGNYLETAGKDPKALRPFFIDKKTGDKIAGDLHTYYRIARDCDVHEKPTVPIPL